MKKEVNGMIGVWSLIFVIAIGLRYVNEYVWLNQENKMFTGGYFLSFFMFLFGFRLVSFLKKRKGNNTSVYKDSWKFEFDNIKTYFPPLLIGVGLAFLVRNLINGTHIWQLFGLFINSIWEFLGLSQLGFVGIYEIRSLVVDNINGFSHIWNQPLWLFSGFIIVGYFLYYLLEKNEELFKNILAPAIIIITFSTFGMTNIDIFSLSKIGLSWSLLIVLASSCVGILSYYIITYLKKKKFSENMLLIFSFLHIGCAVYFLFTIYTGILSSVVTHSLIILIFFIILMVNNDYVSNLYNKLKFGPILEEIAKYYYATFIIFVFLFAKILPDLSYGFSMMFNVIFSLGLSCIIYLLVKLFKKAK